MAKILYLKLPLVYKVFLELQTYFLGPQITLKIQMAQVFAEGSKVLKQMIARYSYRCDLSG